MENRGHLVGGSASGDLIAALRVVEDSGLAGEPRFQPGVQRHLQRMVLTRTHGKTLLEFVYFVSAASANDPRRQRYEGTIWGPSPATARAFRNLFANHPGADAQGVTVSDGTFIIHFSRMPLLAALAEFLVTALGYDEFDRLVQPVCGRNAGTAAAGDAANAIGRAISAWLGPRLDSVHVQQRMRLVSERLADGDDTEIDRSILDAWQDWSTDPETAPLGFLTFRSVYRSFVQYRAAAAEWSAQRSVDDARRIGTDRETGEVEPDSLSVLETLDEDAALLATLEQAPLDRVKFLTGRERDALAVLAETGVHLAALALSFLRDRAWGDVQLRITEARRRRRPWTPDPVQSYREIAAAFAALAGKIDQIALATLGVLLEERSEHAVTLMIDMAPDLDLSPAAELFPEGVVAFPGHNPVEVFLRRLETDADAFGAGAGALLADAATALRKTARRGFDPKTRDPESLPAFEAAADMLVGLRRMVARARHLLALGPDLDDRFSDDRPIFTEQFERIYGEAV